MKNYKNSRTVINNIKNSISSRNSSLNKKLVTELKFIVPWAQYDKPDLKNCKNKLVH